MGRNDPRYDARDYATPAAIRSANYDRLRSEGASRENAARIAAKSVDKTLRKIDRGVGLDARAPSAPTIIDTTPPRQPLRVRFPWEPETAGITLEQK